MDKTIFEANVYFMTQRIMRNLKKMVWMKLIFYISTNPGEPLKPLSKVASGGELSRIDACIKNNFFKASRCDIHYF